MDPFAYLVHQNRDRAQENTRRSSDDVRIQRNKEAREKRSELSDGDLETDVSTMSEDLLGDMDPDLFGKGGPSYRRNWEEEVEEREERPRDDDGGGGSQQEPRDQRQSEPPPDEEAPPKAAAESASPGGVPLERPQASPAKSSAKSSAPPSRLPPNPERVQLSPEALRGTPSPPKAAPRGGSSEAGVDSARVNSAPVAVGGGVLFDPSMGFLIAEQFQIDPGQGEQSVEEISLPAVAPELGELLDKLIIGDVTSPAHRKLQALLGRFGQGVLRLCLEKGAKVYLLPSGGLLSSHPLLSGKLGWEVEDAVYLVPARACVFEECCLNRVPQGFHPVLFYFAYAFDHALGGEEFASLRSPAVKASYQACQEGPHCFDDLAGLTPVHYFAQCVEAYLGENDCTDPYWTRQDLYDFDRSMFEYVDYLFKRQNKA